MNLTPFRPAISPHFATDEDVAANAALSDLESRLSGLLALDNATRGQITKMGDKSEAFVRQTLTVLEQNPDIVPPALGLPEARPTWWRWTDCARCSAACSA